MYNSVATRLSKMTHQFIVRHQLEVSLCILFTGNFMSNFGASEPKVLKPWYNKQNRFSGS